jgi:nicotinate-nucleotide--dimethylbenzimidazole phosphoribosyltransferase
MTTLESICHAIAPLDRAIVQRTQDRLDLKTKPRRSLGRLEDLACLYAAIAGSERPPLPRKAVVIMAADHGVAAQGVSAYPQEVTAQMLLNFAHGGAAINVLARHADARVVVVDMGVREALTAPGIEAMRVGPGTQDFSVTAAMSGEEARLALGHGIGLAQRLRKEGIDVVGLGEMGIANTTSASALTAALSGGAVEEVTGLGTGISEAARAHKIAIIRRALALHAPDRAKPLAVLAALGGFEIAGLAGLCLGAASEGMAIVLDGFIASVAALVATRLCPTVREYMIASHRSVESGHRIVLRELGVVPLFDLEMRLGEGTGAALAMTLLDAALKVLSEMASFESAGVTDAGA